MKIKNPKIDNIIEEVAMSLTHNEQGIYSKNEKFSREKITLACELVLEEILNKIERDIIKVKRAVQSTGTFKYDDCYDDCLEIVKKYK